MNFVGRLKYSLKLLAASVLHYSGALRLYWHLTRRGRAVVLMYHRILPKEKWARSFSSDAIVVTPETFTRHLNFLRRYFRPLTLEQFIHHIEQRLPFPPNACLITFDDGWRDNLDHALAVLQEQKIPATIFLPTAYVGSGHCFWQERLSRLLYSLYRTPALHQHPTVHELRLDTLLRAPQTRALQQIKQYARSLKKLDADTINAMLGKLSRLIAEHHAGLVDDDVDTYVDWSQVRQMRRAGVTFGSHAVSHTILTQLPAASVRREFADSRDTIAREAQAPVDALAYPNGDHNTDTATLAREAGFRVAFTTRPGPVSVGDDPYTLRRINIHENATRHIPLFHAILAGVF
jgi:peptidoglycan/xylan/chitin deacetylase (PgdA/CDA1 family)